MKRLSAFLFFCIFCFVSASAAISPEEIRQINQRLDNILRESKDLPQQKKTRIISDIKSIQRILSNESTDDVQDNDNKYQSENRNTPKDMFQPDNSRLATPRLFDALSFKELKSKIKAAWPYRDQLLMIKRIDKNSAFTIEQIVEITKLLDFPNDQKEVAILLLPKAVDLENIESLYGLFWSPADKEKINKIADEYLH